jgi:HAD superfamily hydrolase (TIGR01509 family)
MRFKEHWSILASQNKKNLVVNWSLLDFIRGLKKKVPIALLSNTDKTSIAVIKNEVNLPDYFDRAYFSSEHEMDKLEKPIVDKILKEFRVKPEEVLFVDDFPGNIEKAKRMGMQTILFIGADDLKSRLKGFI